MILLAALTLSCVPVALHDADTLRCEDGTSIRLSGINAREIGWNGTTNYDAGCRRNAPCPRVDAVTARDHLARLIGIPGSVDRNGNLHVSGQPLSCVVNGKSYNRVTAWCYSGRVDLSCALVRSGDAAVWKRYWKGHRCG